MPRFSMIYHVDGNRQFITGEEISAHINALKELKESDQNVWVECLSVEGINAFMITQNGSKNLKGIVAMLDMFKDMHVENIAKSMYLAIFRKIDVMETPKHFHRIFDAMRINPSMEWRLKAERLSMFHFEWQGFEFLF